MKPKQNRFFLFLIFLLMTSCGSHIQLDLVKKIESSGDGANQGPSREMRLRSLGFKPPYSSSGSAANPVVKVEVPNRVGIVKLFKGEGCEDANVVGFKYSTGLKNSVDIRLGNLEDGSYSIHAKFIDKNLEESDCVHIENYDLTNRHFGIVSVIGSPKAFVAIREDGSVITWGNSSFGGDSSAVSNELDGSVDVVSIASTETALAAIRSDGSVVTWGSPEGGGDSSLVASQLDGSIKVKSIA